MKKLIIFDLDNTLFQSKESYPFLLAEQIKERWGLEEKKSLEAMKKAEISLGSNSNFNSIKDFYYEYDKKILIELFGERGTERMEEFMEIVNRMKEIVPVKLKLYPGVLETLEKLKKLGYHLAILTGTWEQKVDHFLDKEYAEQKRKTIIQLLKNSGIDKFVDGLFVTYDKAIIKPHPEAFNMVLRHFSCNPEEAIMIGDKEADILSSRVGITSILFNPKKKYSGETKPDYEFGDYKDLIEIISSI